MRRGHFIGCVILFMCLFIVFPVHGEEKAGPQEVVQKVKEAAEFLSKAGEEGISEFTTQESRWVWKDTYVWVLNCENMTNAAHPIKPKLVGMNLAGIKDIKGNYFFIQFCDKVKNPEGGWVEYWWPKVGEKTPSRKITYVLQVPNTPYQVGAGIYDEEITMEELNELIK